MSIVPQAHVLRRFAALPHAREHLTSLPMKFPPLLMATLGLLSHGAAINSASADTCHGTTFVHADELSLDIKMSAVAATYREASSELDYQGAAVTVQAHHRWVSFGASLGAYRIRRDDGVHYGSGDLALITRIPFQRGQELRSGASLAATLPTGSPQYGLGMGHTMLMPGLFLSFETDSVRLFIEATYGRALEGAENGSAASHHGGQAGSSPVQGPVVNPMNRSELGHLFAVDVGVFGKTSLIARLFGAVPVSDKSGQSREAAGVGLRARGERSSFTFELQMPVVGTPFTMRTVASLDVRW